QTRPKPEHRRRAATLASRRKAPAPQPPTAQPSGHIFCVCAILPPFKTVAQSISESQWLIRLGRVIFGSILKAVSASSGSRSISFGLLRLGPWPGHLPSGCPPGVGSRSGGGVTGGNRSGSD